MNKKYNLFPKLIECRELLGYTQSDMASIAGVSPLTLDELFRMDKIV